MLLKISFLLVLELASCQGFLFGKNQSDWNGLKVTWGINPLSSFKSLPRTRTAAEDDGWVPMESNATCDSNELFRGERYWLDNDLGVILVYDPSGHIAGIQAGIPKDYPTNPNNYPFPELIDSPFVLDGDNYYITAYFVDPDTLCDGRTIEQFDNEGTGVGLWIQNGTDPVEDSVRMPETQDEANRSAWTEGSCFITMGVHYWYNISQDMSCNNFFPVFLLYNDEVLNAFGWAFGMNLENSKRFEHPPQSSYDMFMDPVPDCFSTMGTLTTLHIYLTDSATSDLC